jgi:5-methylcytosine-specific restriction endonuclease McrA
MSPYYYSETRQEWLRKYWGDRRLKIRFMVFQRDGFRCRYCGRKPPDVVLQIDHAFPSSKGGPNAIENYLTSCEDCNVGKGDMILNEFASAPSADAGDPSAVPISASL